MNTFLINNVRYVAKDFSYGMVRKLEKFGISMGDMGDMPLTLLSGYLAVCGNMSIDEADEQIEQHIIKGGSLDDLQSAVGKAIDESGFFRAIMQSEETETEPAPKKRTSKAN